MVSSALWVVAQFLVCLAIAASSHKSSHRLTQNERTRRDAQSDLPECGFRSPAVSVKAPKSNVWSQISAEDNLAVWQLLHHSKSGLNLTDPALAQVNDNYVFWVDTLHTNKSDVLPYITGSGPAPQKYARAIIFEGGKPEPVSQEYMIGPLPVSSSTRIEKLDYMYNGGSGGKVPYNGRNFDTQRIAAINPLLTSTMTNLSDITNGLFPGAAYYGETDNRTTLFTLPTTPNSFDGRQAYAVLPFMWRDPSLYLMPIDFIVIIDCPGTDAALYKLRGIVTNSRFFNSSEALRKAYEAGELKEALTQGTDDSWTLENYHPDMGQRELESEFAPQCLEIGKKRYKVDDAERYVEYMGWSFYVAHTRSLGVMFYDIRFKGERILYELSMQEALAQYGGYTPKSAGTVYHDTYYDLGTWIYPVVEGFDCPFGSTFWNMTYHAGNKTTVSPNAICLFETDVGYPLSRHRSYGPGVPFGFFNLGTTKGSALTLRSFATVGNYDYLYDYSFHLDGSLEVTVRASGYLQSSFYYKDQGAWGPRVHDATQGSVHDHVLTWKADFDVLGTENKLQVTRLEAAETTQPWFPELGTFEQLTLKTSTVGTEQQFNWDANGQSMYTIVHKDATNKWGEKRGYRILPGRSNIHLTPMNSPFSRDSSPFSKTHLAVSRQHDTEPYANSVQNLNMPWKPQQDFKKFFDGESIDGEDLVLWFNLGMHHFTRAEDVPVTLYTDAVSSIVFAPQNFFDQAQNSDLKNRRWLTPDFETGQLNFDDYGIKLPQCAVRFDEPASRMMAQMQVDASEN